MSLGRSRRRCPSKKRRTRHPLALVSRLRDQVAPWPGRGTASTYPTAPPTHERPAREARRQGLPAGRRARRHRRQQARRPRTRPAHLRHVLLALNRHDFPHTPRRPSRLDQPERHRAREPTKLLTSHMNPGYASVTPTKHSLTSPRVSDMFARPRHQNWPGDPSDQSPRWEPSRGGSCLATVDRPEAARAL